MMNSNIDVECPPAPKDWRITLFGPTIQQYCEPKDSALVPTEVALNDHDYDYIGVFFGADYCPFCKKFAPKLVESYDKSLQYKRLKVILASNDRDVEAFDRTCAKVKGIDAIPYDTSRTRHMRDIWGFTTIPAFVILKNSNFEASTPPVVTLKGRDHVESDMQGVNFPWEEKEGYPIQPETKEAPVIKGWDRFMINGEYGDWWSLGHKINPEEPEKQYMDEHAVRIRAGILNIITWIALMNVFFWKDLTMVEVIFPIVAWEFFISTAFGLTPLAPMGTLATLIAMVLQPNPLWKPAAPKRFAWIIGFTLASLCFAFVQIGKDTLGDAYRPLIATVVFTCNVFTWLESSCGFCFGCFVYNRYLVPRFGLEECSECKI
jgi:thiol-disulfide isomerase/thioredoxin